MLVTCSVDCLPRPLHQSWCCLHHMVWMLLPPPGALLLFSSLSLSEINRLYFKS
uniref:Uncharacterized protein n=1 Tax=Arundo donax TaxID=35708 RepID=A0A0A8Y9J9_ARUDO